MNYRLEDVFYIYGIHFLLRVDDQEHSSDNYLETGHNLQALSTIEQALKVEPNHPTTLLNRVKALFALGYRRQAIAQAKSLVGHSDVTIANQASALLLSYT